ncbi:unnamed protein product [Cylindrotheca closterium]|uniref:Leucine-rich repeat-containing N-terminal plant-type domain-containing protein n=1 Tax=Cylindrotheca closterium TaxID=2856 RepID=A0AAD2G4R3_9STRA|nr:unnamed protein product [Cylindrotheca closterium]
MMTSTSNPDKQANGVPPTDVEQPSMLIRENSIRQHSSNKVNFGVLLVAWAVLVTAALVAGYVFLFAPIVATEVPLKPTSNFTINGPIVVTPEITTSPTPLDTTLVPSTSPTLAPTVSKDFKGAIEDFLLEGAVEVRSSANQAVAKAIDWLAAEAAAANSLFFPFDEKYLQRFGILILYYSVFTEERELGDGEVSMPNIGMRTQDECFWRGMKCDKKGRLVEIKLGNRQLDGVLPSEWGFFPRLKSIDFSKNDLKGSIPGELYDIRGLEEVFMYKNQLSGTISTKIGKLWSLKRWHVSQNKLSGSIPRELQSQGNKLRQLRYFNVHRNQMTGSIPSNLRWRQIVYMDLGNNKFSSEIPEDFGREAIRLRHLYLDHNNFEGSVPSTVLNSGGDRIRTLTLNDNNFTGTLPVNNNSEIIVELTIQNNNIVSMDRSSCQLGVFSGGELVEFKSDCLVCRCGFGLMCRNCQL